LLNILIYIIFIEYNCAHAIRVRVVQSAGPRSVQHEEGAMPDPGAARRPDLRAEHVEGKGRGRGRERRVAAPLDFEKPDGDPDGELVGPDGGQVHDGLEPLGPEIRALPPVRRRARTEVDVLEGGLADEVDATTRERAEAAVGRLRVH